MTRAVFGVANHEDHARHIVDRLLSSGFSNEDISIVYPNKNNQYTTEDTTMRRTKRNTNFSTEKHTKAPEGAATGALAGGILGGSLGLLAGIGSLAIPGLGPFIAAGPIMAALSGSAIGGSAGLLVGTLVGAGIPEYEAKKYEERLREGHILVSVNADTDQDIRQAESIMREEGATEVSVSREKTKSRY